MSLESLMVNTVAIQASTATRDASGAPRLTFTTVDGKDAVACSIHPATAELRREYASRDVRVSHRIYFIADHGFQKNYRIRGSDGKYYIVHGDGNFAGRDRVWFADCEEQK